MTLPHVQATAEPLVSVVLPVFNGAAYIELALKSILNQTYRNLDVIVIDDGSTDATPALIRAAESDRRLRLVSRENRGLVSTLNEGLGLARGDLIARMDADDIAYPERIQRQVDMLLARPELAITGTAIETLSGEYLWGGPLDPAYTTGCLKTMSLFFTVFIHPTVMFNRSVIGDELYYNPAYAHAEDFELFRRLTARFPAGFLPEPLLAYRQHPGSVTKTHRQLMWKNHLRIVVENLRNEGFKGDIDALESFASDRDTQAAHRAALFLKALEEEIAYFPPGKRESCELGFVILAFLMLDMLLDQGRSRDANLFLKESGVWGRLRRRERALLQVAQSWPSIVVRGMELSRRLQTVLDRRHSRAADRALASIGVRR